ncbi:PQQ-binding-like beta-propeller repeat protein [bacterium]|nr:PQQ-binding-like beta-propeller repeat protein [bacterium]
MKSLFALLLSFVFLSYCTSLRAPESTQSGKVSVEKLTSVPLTEKVNFRLKEKFSDSPWEWRGRNTLGAPSQSYVPARFVNDKDALIVTLGGGVTLFDTWLGSKIWEVEVPIGVGSQVAFDKKYVFVAGMDRKLRKIEISSGSIVWEAQISAESTGGILLTKGLVYVTASDNSLWAIDVLNGKALWTYKRPNSQKAVLWSLRGSSIPKLSPDGKTLYVGFADGYFVSLNSMSGDTVWEKNYERPGRFVDADVEPVLSRDGRSLYLALVDGDLIRIDTSNGNTVWKLPNASHSAPLLDEEEGVLYYSTNDSRLVKASLQSGSIFWVVKLEDKGVASLPASISDSLIAVTTTRFGFLVIDKDNGKIHYSDYLGSGVLTPPSFHNGKVLVLSPRNDLFIYRVNISS